MIGGVVLGGGTPTFDGPVRGLTLLEASPVRRLRQRRAAVRHGVTRSHDGCATGRTPARTRHIRTWEAMPGCWKTVVSCIVSTVPLPASTARRYIASASAMST